MRFVRQSREVRVAIGSLIAAVLLWLPAFRRPFATGFGDWQFFHHMWEAGYVALKRYHEWPLWDPFHCGGITIFGNPQSQHLSPLYLISLLAGPTLGTKLFVVMHAWAGFAGMYLLGRRERLSVTAASLASLTWCASGFFVWHVATGHAAFLPFYFAPWIILSVKMAIRNVRYASALAALLALTLLEGGVYPFPYFVLLSGVTILTDGSWRKERVRPLAALLCATILTALMGAVRLWPIIDELRRNPRTMPSGDGVSPLETIEMLTARDHSWLWPSHGFVWVEYGSYVGTAVCGLAVIGLLSSLRRRGRSLVTGAVVFYALMLGDHGSASPWAWLHALPVYDSLRVPSRFTVLFTLYLTLLAGYGLDMLLRIAGLAPYQMRRHLRTTLAIALLVPIAVNLAMVQYPIINRWRHPRVRTNSVSPRFYLTELPYHAVLASLPRMNLGSSSCYEAMNFKRARGLWVGDKPQARIVRSKGKIGELGRTTSRAFFEVTLSKQSRVVINQNYAPGWRTSVGWIESDRGRLALELPAGTHRVELEYRPRMLWPSITLSLIGALFAILLARFGDLTVGMFRPVNGREESNISIRKLKSDSR
jgi:hypothetical protein